MFAVPDVTAVREGRLLGLAVSPDFAEDNLVYAVVATAQNNRIIRFPLRSTAAPEVQF